VIVRAEGNDALLGATLFLVPPSSTECRVEPKFVQGLFQAFGLPHFGVKRAVIEWIDSPGLGLGILMYEQLHAAVTRHLVAQLVHGCEFPCGVDVQ
jgi:hypothetical protein